MDQYELKLVLVGNTNVGKTCIVRKAISGSFNEETSSTLGASYSTKDVQVGNASIRMQIWDTAGQEKYRSMTPMYYHNAHVAVIVYSVDDANTFNAVDAWLQNLRENASEDIIIFLVGNKQDLSDLRVVSEDSGLNKANLCGMQFTEVSAKTGFGIDDLFNMIPRVFLEHRSLETEEKAEVRLTSARPKKKCC